MPCAAPFAASSVEHRPRDPAATALYGLIREHCETFRHVVTEAGGVPSFVMEAFERYLRCGVLAQGFARFLCDGCGYNHLVPLSCKGRGLCPSCAGRRMTALTRHIMDAELPHVPVRQWVLSLPHPLRYRLAYDQPLCTAVHRILGSAIKRRIPATLPSARPRERADRFGHLRSAVRRRAESERALPSARDRRLVLS